MKLYELTGALRRIQELADDEAFDTETGEYTEPSEETKAILDTLDMAFEEKIEAIAKVIKAIEAEHDGIKKEADRLAARAKSYKRQIDWLKRYAQEAMDSVGKPKFKTTLFTFWVQPSDPPVVITEGTKVPEEFLKPAKAREADKTKLKKALKAGKEFAGIFLGEATRSFRFR